MASFLDKLKVNTAVVDHTKLDLSSDHISTANFMQYNVAWSKELVPGEKIEVDMETFTRLAPMPVPTFGRARINNRAFFVPFRTIFPGWNDFITDTRHSFSNGSSYTQNFVPRIDINRMFEVFEQHGWIQYADEEAGQLGSIYDISTDEEYYLKPEGRQALKLMNSLGYQWSWESAPQDSVYVSALPLMAIAKIYYDWYYPSAWAQDPVASEVNGILSKDDTLDVVLSVSQIGTLINFMSVVNYDSDYFVSAWENPMAPNNGAFSQTTIGDITLSDASSTEINVDGDNGTSFINGNRLTQYAVDALKSLTDYMKRHQLVGARALDRYLARFGVQLSAEKLKRSVYIGTTTDDIQFGDVTSTANTEGAALGYYAGKGLGFGKSGFEFETDEYGIMIIISSILPKQGYYQGFDRNTLHVGRLDYWTPEFDNLGTQAIAKGELYLPMNRNIMNEEEGGVTRSLYDGVFGWTPRYAEYKVSRDRLTGDFRYAQVNTGLDSWHTMRNLLYGNISDIVINDYFVTGKDAGQYSRIFYNYDADVSDKFNVIYHFNVASYSPMKPLWDTYEFEDKGKSVTMNANGVKMN